MAEGALVEETYTRLGLFAARRLQVTPSARRDELVDRLRSVLVGGSEPDERTALLVVALDSFVPFKHFLAKDQVKPARRRAAKIVATVDEDYRALVTGVKRARANGSGGDVMFT